MTIVELDRTEAHDLSRRLLARSTPAPAPTGVDVEGPCLLWDGATVPDGRGFLSVASTGMHTARASFLAHVGPVPVEPSGKTYQVRTVCGVLTCISPAHLAAVTQAENLRLQVAAKTHCPAGHPYSPENTIMRRHGAGRPKIRSCRECAAASTARYYARKKAESTRLRPARSVRAFDHLKADTP